MIEIFINDTPVEAQEGSTILQVARTHKIPIPHLCYHPALKPSGSCKVCGVEVASPSGRQTVMLSCILKVKQGLKVKTESDLVTAAREKAFRKLLELAPDSDRIRKLAETFKVVVPPRPNGCIRCRLCVRVCNDVVGAHAIKMIKTETGARVVPADGTCIGCGTCENLCPTKVIQIRDQGNVRVVSVKDEVISRLPLERCEACGNLYATTDFLTHVVEHMEPHPDTKDHHHLCAACAKLMSDRTLAERRRFHK